MIPGMEDVLELDRSELINTEWLLSLSLFKHPVHGYLVEIRKPAPEAEVESAVMQLPEQFQNMIQVYLPMLTGE